MDFAIVDAICFKCVPSKISIIFLKEYDKILSYYTTLYFSYCFGHWWLEWQSDPVAKFCLTSTCQYTGMMTSSNGNIFRVTGLCPRNHRSPLNSPHKGQWRGALMFFLHLCLNKRLSKQSWGWWFETPSRSLWRHYNGWAVQRLQWRFLYTNQTTKLQCTFRTNLSIELFSVPSPETLFCMAFEGWIPARKKSSIYGTLKLSPATNITYLWYRGANLNIIYSWPY